MQHIIKILEKNCNKYSDKAAVSMFTVTGTYRSYTYSQLFNETKAYSIKIINTGISVGDRLALISENSPEWVISYFSILYSRCTPVLIDSSLSKLELLEYIEKSDVRGIMLSPKVKEKLNPNKNTEVPIFNILNKAEVFEGYPSRLPQNCPPTIDPAPAVIAIIYSSGTTSTAKGVMFDSKGVLATVNNNIISNRLKPGDRFLAVVPLNHIYGYMAKMLCPLFSGATVCFLESVSSESLNKAFLTFKPTSFAGVPRVFDMFGTKINDTILLKGEVVAKVFKVLLDICSSVRKYTGINLGKTIFRSVHKSFGGSIKIFMSAGSVLDKQTVSMFYGLGFYLLNNYGITETNIPIAANTYSNYTLDTCGKVFKDVKIKINAESSQEIGEILVKSPGVMIGYFRDKAATEIAFDSNNWFRTGDLGYFDKNQNLNVTGRIKENIVLDTGKKVTPDDIEKAFGCVSGVSELVVCGVPKNKHSYDVAHVFLVKNYESDRKNSEIESDIWLISSKLPTHMRISKIHFLDAIPKTSLQKPKRYLLKRLAISMDTAVQETAFTNEIYSDLTHSENEAIIFELISRFRFSEELAHKKSRLVEDLGFDSLSITELSLLLEKRTGVNISSYLKPNITIGEIIERIDNEEFINNTDINDISQFPMEKRFFEITIFKFLKTLFKLFYKIDVSGLENLPANGGYLICPNHETHFDAFFILTYLPDRLYKKFCCLAKMEHTLNPFGRFMLRIAGGIPVDRYGNPGPALVRCYEKLVDGNIVLIHPEGTRTNNGQIGEFKKGAAKLAIDTGLPIIPVRIKGGYEIYPKGKLIPKLFNFEKMKRYCLKISFGSALLPVSYDVDSLNAALRNRIIEQ